MMKKYFLLLMGALLGAHCYAQTFTGVVKNAKTNQPLQFVNVGIIGKGVGTVTDAEGRFNLNLAGQGGNDSLRISMVGYQPRTMAVSAVSANIDLYKNTLLQPETKQLAEVKVSNHKWKQAVLGNTTTSQSTNAGFNSNKLGNEIGTIIKLKKKTTNWLKQFNASISGEVPDSVKLRLNFYTLKDGMPDQLLQHENIIITVNKGQKSINVNLEPYSIYVEDNFFVSLEWIKNSRGHGIMFSAKVLGGSVISKETSQAKWEKEGIVGLGFNVLAEY